MVRRNAKSLFTLKELYEQLASDDNNEKVDDIDNLGNIYTDCSPILNVRMSKEKVVRNIYEFKMVNLQHLTW